MAGGRPYSPEEDAILRAHPDAGGDELVRLIPGRSADSMGNRRRFLSQREGWIAGKRKLARVFIPESEKEQFNANIHLDGDSCLALFDIHLPYHDAPFIENAVNLAVSWGIDTCIIGGDLIDAAAFSKFGPDPEEIFEEELQAAEDFMAPLAKAFAKVAYCLGNHEARLLGRALNRQLKTARFLRLITHAENVEITSYEWLTMAGTPGDLPWLFAHPKNASVIAGRVPSMIASRSRPGFHVVSGHGHMCGIVRTDDGKRWAIDSGMCADGSRLEYAVKSISTRPAMAQGAVIVYRGHPYLLTPISDFAALSRMYAPAA